MSEKIKIGEGISDLSDSYSGFLVDQWGTLHNGREPYEGVVDALTQLKRRGKQIIVLSNSGQLADQNGERLRSVGLDPSLFDHIVTSAEVTWQLLSNRSLPGFEGLGNRAFLFNREGNISAIADTGIETVDRLADADFILLTGSDAPERLLDNYYDPLLKEGSRLRLKMICANPEMKMTIDGVSYMGAGEIARRYIEFGGVVTHIGKPFPHIYHHALGLFKDVLPSQVVMVGDSLSHDIRGAQSVGLDSALIASGFHAGSFKKVRSTADIHSMLKILGQNYGIMPTWFIPRFAWGKQLPDRKNKLKKTRR